MTEVEIRRSLVNSSKSETTAVTFPPALHDVVWEDLEYFGWRDPKLPQRGYIIAQVDGEPIGLMVRAADSRMSSGKSLQCVLCRSVHKADRMSLFTAKRTGPAGRNGDTVGTYICADLDCSQHIRIPPLVTPLQPDPDAAVAERIAGLLERLHSFIGNVTRT